MLVEIWVKTVKIKLLIQITYSVQWKKTRQNKNNSFILIVTPQQVPREHQIWHEQPLQCH